MEKLIEFWKTFSQTQIMKTVQTLIDDGILDSFAILSIVK